MAEQTERRFELITAQHNVALFRCENGYLTTYLQTHALSETEKDLARTFVLTERLSPSADPEIIGYVTRGRGVAVHNTACPNVQNLLYQS